jgi:hypothetical protein
VTADTSGRAAVTDRDLTVNANADLGDCATKLGGDDDRTDQVFLLRLGGCSHMARGYPGGPGCWASSRHTWGTGTPARLAVARM